VASAQPMLRTAAAVYGVIKTAEAVRALLRLDTPG